MRPKVWTQLVSYKAQSRAQSRPKSDSLSYVFPLHRSVFSNQLAGLDIFALDELRVSYKREKKKNKSQNTKPC